VLHLNHFLQQEKNEPHKIKKVTEEVFSESIDNDVFSKKSNKQLRRYVMIENLKKIGITHVQTAIEIPQHLNRCCIEEDY
jgi:tRNA(Ile)-lysidine synthase TilS/MesJ